MKPKTICLNMIVKNECTTILRCLSSVKGIIDDWVIADTGSTDGTQQLVEEFMKGVPGRLIESEWVNFETNRNWALDAARNRADYILTLDADDVLEVFDEFNKNSLDLDAYALCCCDPIVDSYRLLMINNDPDWKWVGVLHEELMNPKCCRIQILQGIKKNGLMRDGHRMQDPERYRKDAAILEKELAKDPQNPRLVFYLAQSYAVAYENQKAIHYYEQRAKMGGHRDEIFWSLYFSACLKDNLNLDATEVIKSYWKAYEFDPSRAEPLCFLARYLLKMGNPAQAHRVARMAIALPRPKSLFYVQREVYDYASLLYFAFSQHLLLFFDDAIISYQMLLESQSLPQEERSRVEQFLELCQKRQRLQVVA
jgi:glycosyltransferase involved in cell wall biosynthesis